MSPSSAAFAARQLERRGDLPHVLRGHLRGTALAIEEIGSVEPKYALHFRDPEQLQQAAHQLRVAFPENLASLEAAPVTSGSSHGYRARRSVGPVETHELKLPSWLGDRLSAAAESIGIRRVDAASPAFGDMLASALGGGNRRG